MYFRKSGNRAAFAGYMLVNLWIVVGFGLLKGFYGTALRLFVGTALASESTAFAAPAIGTIGVEMSGLAMWIGSLFVFYYGYRLLDSKHNGRANVTLAAVAATSLVATLAAYVFYDRDRWIEPDKGVVKIGVIVPTDGPYAILGNSFVKAVQMAKDDLRDTKYRYELVIRNSGPDPAKAEAVIRSVIAEDKVDAVVGGISLIGQVTKPYATRARIPHLCVCTVSAIGDGAYNFTNIPSPEAEGTLWAREARRRGIATIALVTQDYPSINNHVKALKIEAARVGLAVIYERMFADTVSDFRAMLADAEASKPDVYYVEALNPALDRLAEQMAAANIRNVASVVAPSLSDRAELFEGAWYTDSNLRDIAFKTRFEDKYPGTRFATHMMPYAYDSLNMIVRAYERGQNPAVYLRNLRSYEGTAGRLTKSPGSGAFASTPAVWIVQYGRPALLDR
jgi:ABC-type branched-subunit amino acid transport system substrate-binding protein